MRVVSGLKRKQNSFRPTKKQSRENSRWPSSSRKSRFRPRLTSRSGAARFGPSATLGIKKRALQEPQVHNGGAVRVRVLKFRVYADRNYWTTTGWEDDAVSNFDESACGRVEGRAGDACGHGEGAGAAAPGSGEAV